jgi:hypothetical protein
MGNFRVCVDSAGVMGMVVDDRIDSAGVRGDKDAGGEAPSWGSRYGTTKKLAEKSPEFADGHSSGAEARRNLKA